MADAYKITFVTKFWEWLGSKKGLFCQQVLQNVLRFGTHYHLAEMMKQEWTCMFIFSFLLFVTLLWSYSVTSTVCQVGMALGYLLSAANLL